MCVTAETVKAAIGPRTKAIVAVHLFGNVAPMAELRELGLPVLEDAAQATGARLGDDRAGSLGDAATFSFFPSKNLPCLGDGGAVTTDDDDVAAAVRRLRFHGSDDKKTFVDVGYNSRLDELQAALLRIFLSELDGWIALRREAAARYAELGLGAACELPEDEPGHVYHLFVCRSPERDRIRAALKEAGIGNAVYYTTPLHLQQAFSDLGHAHGSLPVTEQLALDKALRQPMTEAQHGEDVEVEPAVV